MLGGPALSIGLTASLTWVALALIARKEADFDWHKMLIITAVIAVVCAILPMILAIFLFENLQLDATRWWGLLVAASLLLQIGFFVLMLNRQLWVSIPKALLVWGFVQAVSLAKEYVFYREPGEGFAAFAYHSVSGRDMDLAYGAKTDVKPNPELAAFFEENAGGVRTPPATGPATANAVAAAPAAATVAAKPAKDAPPPAGDPRWEEARRLLEFKGKAEGNGRVMIFVNREVVEIGRTVQVTYQGSPYTFRLVAVTGEHPQWEPAP